MQELELPDGTVVEFPDGMSNEDMLKALKANQSAIDKASVKPYEDAEASRPARMTQTLRGQSLPAGDITPPEREPEQKTGLLSARDERRANEQAKKVGDVAAGRVGGSAAELRDEVVRAQARETAMSDPVRNIEATLEALPQQAKKVAGGLIQATAEGAGGRPTEGLMPEQLAGPTDEQPLSVKDALADIGATWGAAADAEEKKIKAGLKPGLGTEAVQTAIESAAIMLPAMATGGTAALGAGGVTAAARAAGARMLFGTMGATTFGTSYGEARRAGMDPADAGAYGALQAMIEVGTEFAPLRALFSAQPNFAKRFANFMVQEVPQELLATTLQAAVDKASVNPNMTWEDFQKQLALTVLSTPLAGGAQTAVAHGASGIVGAPKYGPEDRARVLAEELERAVDTTEFAQSAESVAAGLLNPAGAQMRVAIAPVLEATNSDEAVAAATAAATGQPQPAPQATPTEDSTSAAASATLAGTATSTTDEQLFTDGASNDTEDVGRNDTTRSAGGEGADGTVAAQPATARQADDQRALGDILRGTKDVVVESDGWVTLEGHPLVAVDPAALPESPSADRPNRLTREQAEAIDALAEKSGKRVIFYEDHGLLPDGFVAQHVTNGVVFVSDNPQKAGSFVASHELTHAFDELKDLADAVRAVVNREITADGIDLMQKRHGLKFPSDPVAQRAFLVKEAAADLGGWALSDPQFLPKVVEEVRARQGDEAATTLVQKLLKAITDAITKVQRIFRQEKDLSAQVVKNLEAVHAALAKLYGAQYSSQIEIEKAKLEGLRRKADMTPAALRAKAEAVRKDWGRHRTSDTAELEAQDLEKRADALEAGARITESPKPGVTYTHEVYDTRTGEAVKDRVYQSRSRARLAADKMDLAYGAVRYAVRPIPEPTGDVTKSRKESGDDSLEAHVLRADRQARTEGARARLNEVEKAAAESASRESGIPTRVIEATVREHKRAHPQSQGWAPLVFKGLKAPAEPGGKWTYEYQIIPYAFDKDNQGRRFEPGSDAYKRRVEGFSQRIADEVRAIHDRAQNGNTAARNIIRQAGWYRNMRDRLRREFGGLGDLFADLLGATSPNTPVRDNWSNASDVLRRATRGDFDELMPKWVAWVENVETLEMIFRGVVNDMLDRGLTKKAIKDSAEYAWWKSQVAKARELPEELLPTKESGKKYGFNGRNVVRALVDLWRVVKNADPDIGRGGTAPKALNFSGNLIGFREGATIDVWAARLLQRLAGLLRIPSRAESAVSGEMRASGETTLQFGFGQDVFARAAALIRQDASMSRDETLRALNPDDLQALVWFIEKELWTKNNWTSAAGEGGSFEFEADLAGVKDTAKVVDLRRVADSSLSTPAQRTSALRELDAMKRPLSRIIAGLSIQQSVWTQGVDYVPTDADMARTSEVLTTAMYEGGARAVVGVKVLSSQGRYGSDIERAFDIEGVFMDGYDAGPLWKTVLEVARDRKQDSTFISRALFESEDVDPAKHVPGVEIYFREARVLDKAEGILEQLAGLGVGNYTVIVDARRSPSAIAGAMPAVVGVRFQWIPEFDVRYGGPEAAPATDVELAARAEEKAAEYDRLARKVAVEIPGVSYAKALWYDTEVRFAHEYQGAIDALANRDAGAQDPLAGERSWAGRQRREGLQAAARQHEIASRAAGERESAASESRDADGGDAGQEVTRSAKRGEEKREAGEDHREGRGDGAADAEVQEGNRRDVADAATRDRALARVPEGFSRQVGPNTPVLAFRQGPHPIAIVGVHYGNVEGLSHLDGTKFGTGTRSEEARRVALMGNAAILKRVYFYAQTEDGKVPRSEGVVTAPYVYRAVLDNLYDFGPDPEGMIPYWRKLRTDPKYKDVDPSNLLEALVLLAGYDGYLNRQAGALVVMGRDSVPAEFLGDRGEAWQAITKSAKQRETEEFKRWAGDAEFVSREDTFVREFASGVPVVVETLHGTTGNFTRFSRDRADPEADLGAGFYSTNNPRDVAANYAGEGPDLTNKITRTVEREFTEADIAGAGEEYVRNWVRRELGVEHGGLTMPLYVRFRNPAVLGGRRETRLSYDDRTLERFANAVRKAAEAYDVYRLEDALAKLDEGPLRDAKVVIGTMDANDDQGNLVGSEIFRAALERMGFDGVIDQTVSDKFRTMDGMDEPGTTHFVAFKPNQLKSAIGNRGTFNRGDDITKSAKSWYYSALARAVEQAGMKAAPASAWRDWLRGQVQKGVVKADELEWSGVNDWLGMQQGKVTRDAVAEFLRANGVRVEEKVLGAERPLSTAEAKDILSRGGSVYAVPRARPNATAGATLDDGRTLLPYIERNPDQNFLYEGREEDAHRRVIGTKFDQWQLPGGKNYREILLTLPEARGPFGAKFQPRELPDGAEVYDRDTGQAVERATNLRTAIDRANAYNRANNDTPVADRNFRSSHFDQPNILAHIRFNERTDAEGKRVLFVEEIQSDWAQKGRDQGFTQDFDTIPDDFYTEPAPDYLEGKYKFVSRRRSEPAVVYGAGNTEAEAIEKGHVAWRELRPQNRGVGIAQAPFISGRKRAEVQAITEERLDDRGRKRTVTTGWKVFVTTDGERKEIATGLGEKEARALAERESKKIGATTEAWVALALKRVIAYAAEHGFDRVAWTNGEQQADRYDLSKQISSLQVTRDTHPTNGTIYWLTARHPEGGEVDGFEKGFKADELADAVGKDLAEKIAKQKADRHVYKGLDLKVGGEGMRAFYDKIVPNVANDVLKKLGGGRVATVQLGGGSGYGLQRVIGKGWQVVDARFYPVNDRTFRSDQDAWRWVFENDPTRKQPGFDIADAMRAKASAGEVPLFSRKIDFRRGDEVVHKRTGETGTVDVVRPRPYTYDDVEFIDSKGDRQTARDTELRHAGTIQRSAKVPQFTEVFWRWFGESKVVDDAGRPLVVYHGDRQDDRVQYPDETPAAITRFEGVAYAGWFAEKSYDADDYAFLNGTGQGAVYPVYLSISRPFDMTAWDLNEAPDFRGLARATGISASELRDIAEEHGPAGSGALWSVVQNPVFEDFLRSKGYDGIKAVEAGNKVWAAIRPEQIKSAIGNDGSFDATNPDITKSPKSAIAGTQIPAAWQATELTEFDAVVRALQDKLVDTKRVVSTIRESGIAVPENLDPYLQEMLFHGRAAKRVNDFAQNELRPLLTDMQARGVKMQDLEDYLWAAHAAERNAQIAKVNPSMPDAGSGLTDAQAADILAGLPVTVHGRTIQLDGTKMAAYAALQARVNAITDRTLDTLVAYGLESKAMVDTWRRTYKSYVPLRRDMEADKNFLGAFNLGLGTGQGFSVRGPSSRRAMGSERNVIDVLANLAMQRERAIVRGEKNRIAQAVYGLATKAPSRDFWLPLNPDLRKVTKANEYYAEWKSSEADYNARLAAGVSPNDPAMTSLELKYLTARDNYQNLIPVAQALQTKVEQELVAMGLNPADARSIAKEPQERYVDPNTGMVMWRLNPRLSNNPEVLSLRMNGENRFVIFSNDERAKAMVTGLKNLDAESLGYLLATSAQLTRWFASVNTQYNPVFGLVNGMRDAGASVLNLGSTPLRGQQAKVLKYAGQALSGIYADLRAHRAGRQPTSVWAQRFEDMGLAGGQTGYRDAFQTSAARADALTRELKAITAGKSKWLKINESNPIFAWLSDYNTAIENAIRVAVFQSAREMGMSDAKAASLAKGITVNFNKKGTAATNTGALYAFFNAAVQGTARIGETMLEHKGDPSKAGNLRLSSLGKKILLGGLVLGVMQALLGAAAGWDDDQPPQFQRERNFLVPVPGTDRYVAIPYPLGYHVIPNLGRVATELVLSGGKNAGKRLAQLVGTTVSAFNPIGGGDLIDAITPTVVDPLIALARNKDWTGNPIAREDANKFHPTPGWARTKDTATPWSRALSYAINYATGGGAFGKGLASPTPDQIDYLIGQVTGGVGRELGKVAQTAKSQFTGEELPLYKVPVIGRFVGETAGTAAVANKFYANLESIGGHADPIKRMALAHESARLQRYLRDHPEARLVEAATSVQEKISELRREKERLVREGAEKSRVRSIEDRAKLAMQSFNAAVARIEKQKP